MNIIKIERFSNSYVVSKDSKSFIVDVGRQVEEIIKALENTEPLFVLLTHAHYDHVEGLSLLKEKYNIPVYLHREDLFIYNSPLNNGGIEFKRVKIENLVDEEELWIDIPPFKVKMIHTPGHSPGSSVYLIDDHLFTGDTIFYGSIGRYDLPGGNYELLIESIKNKILSLPENTIIHPGHGEDTTVLFEKENNPFLQ